MSQTVRIDRNAFKRGVQDVMTFAPLREAVKIASGVFVDRSEKSSDDNKAKKKGVPSAEGSVKPRDGKSSR